MKFKKWIIRLLGVFTTTISLVLIYLILFKDGDIQSISKAMLIEFIVIASLCLSTKFFWYTSTENSIRNSDDYLNKRKAVTQIISEEIQDAKDFDTFIDVENDENYNTYVSNHCKNLTIDNYKLSVFDWIHWFFNRKDKYFYLKRYVLTIENKATKLHKLSGSNIRALTTTTDGLTDDRNSADMRKVKFLIWSTLFSLCIMLVTSTIAFTDKENIDVTAAILKMLIYTANIMFSILQAVLEARLIVSTEDIAYFNKIVSIIEKYAAYKAKRYVISRISYMEVIDGSNIKSSET